MRTLHNLATLPLWKKLLSGVVFAALAVGIALAAGGSGGDGSGGGGGGGGVSYPPQPTCPSGDTGSYIWNGSQWVDHCISPVITPNDASLVIAVGNSQSMDGTTSGSIMTGSGYPSVYDTFNGGYQQVVPLTTGSAPASPQYYPVTGGFVPPMGTGSAPAGMAPYTLANANGNLADNGPSRMNMVKSAIRSLVTSYASKFNFALTTYSETTGNLYTTYAYYLPPRSGAYWFTNDWMAPTVVGADHTINNPCYKFSATGDQNLIQACTPIANYYNKTKTWTISNYKYLVVGRAGDDYNINDILYSQNATQHQLPVTFMAYGGETAGGQSISDSNPYWNIFSLGEYNQGSVSVSFNNVVPSNGQMNNYPNNCSQYACKFTGGAKYLSPTNSGYLPSAGSLWYVQRGFGFYSAVSPDIGATMVNFISAGANPTPQSTQAVIDAFGPALQPESSNGYGSEMKSLAGQSPIAGLLKFSGQKLDLVSTGASSCAGKYVILITDGLPTEDLNGNYWPPMGTPVANGFGVTVTYNTDGTYDVATSNDQAATDAINQVLALQANGIKTYVIGVGAGVNPGINPTASKFLQALALAGGTQKFYPANDQSALNDAIQAIGEQIQASMNISAPVTPSYLSGGSLIYQVTSNSNYGAYAGHLQAFKTIATPTSTASAPVGTITGNAVWDAGDPSSTAINPPMTGALRKNSLYSTAQTPSAAAPGSGQITTLYDLGQSTTAGDVAAFALPSPASDPCLPNDAAVAAYTIDPTYTYTPAGGTTCNYGQMGGRAPNWMVGSLSPNDSVQYLAPPDNPSLTDMPGYFDFMKAQHSRGSQVLFTSNDGILYGINATTGVMDWGWMPRPFLQYIKNYNNFQSGQYFDGQFTTTDAVNTASNPGASNWATYVVGTAQGGAYHYALKLGLNGSGELTPVAQSWGIATPGGSSPQMQAPLIVTTGGMQYAVFLVNTTSTNAKGQSTTTSTLYEINVATGQPSSGTAVSGALPFVASSAMDYESTTGTLWIGDTQGNIWSLNVSGTASFDASNAYLSETNSPAVPVQFVGYTEVGGVPYLWATSSTEIFVYQLSGAQGTLVWAASNTSGYLPTANGPQASSSIMPLHAQGQITIAPQFHTAKGELLLEVHVYVPPSDALCGVGAAYSDFYDFLSGGKPINPITDQNGKIITNFDVYVGQGKPLPTNDAQTQSGGIGYLKSQLVGGPAPFGGTGNNFFQYGKTDLSRPISWRQY